MALKLYDELDDDDLSAPAAVAIVGRSGSGKTTLIEKLIASLDAEGYVVGSIKHHSHKDFEIDHEGKDSWRHRKAGSRHVMIASPNQLVSIQTLDQEMDYPQIVAQMNDVDIVIAEGYRHAGLPVIAIFRAANDHKRKPLEFKPADYVDGELDSRIRIIPLEDPEQCAILDLRDTVAVVGDVQPVLDEAAAAGLPCFDLDDVDGVVDFIKDRFL